MIMQGMSFERPRLKRSIKISPEPGAALLGAAVTIPLLFLVILGMIDFARYFYISSLLNHAAQQAVDYASKIEVEEPTTTVARCSSENANDSCDRFQRRLDGIVNRAIEIGSSAVKPSSQAGATHLLQLTNPYSSYSSSALGDVARDAAFLRPGERAVLFAGTDQEEIIEHPTRPSQLREEGLAFGWPQPSESWSSLMAQHPLAVVMAAEVDPVLPFLPKFRIKALQLAPRKIKTRSAIPSDLLTVDIPDDPCSCCGTSPETMQFPCTDVFCQSNCADCERDCQRDCIDSVGRNVLCWPATSYWCRNNCTHCSEHCFLLPENQDPVFQWIDCNFTCCPCCNLAAPPPPPEPDTRPSQCEGQAAPAAFCTDWGCNRPTDDDDSSDDEDLCQPGSSLHICCFADPIGSSCTDDSCMPCWRNGGN